MWNIGLFGCYVFYVVNYELLGGSVVAKTLRNRFSRGIQNLLTGFLCLRLLLMFLMLLRIFALYVSFIFIFSDRDIGLRSGFKKLVTIKKGFDK
jgi:hypothetical protein